MTKQIQDDFVQPFQLPNINMRGRVVKMNDSLNQIISQHNYPDWVGFQLAECLLLNAAIASAIKLRGVVSLQMRSDGPIKLIATDFTAPKKPGDLPSMRGYVRFDESEFDTSKPLYEKGVFGILIDQGTGVQPYQGMTRLNDSLSTAAQEYFAQSEQIPTRFQVNVVRDELAKTWHGAAVMVQRVAGEGGHSSSVGSEDDINRIEALLGTIASEEILSENIASEELIYRLFHEDEPTANPREPIHFHCPCSAEKVRQSLSIYSQKDLSHMLTDDGKITADCQFCGSHYVMDPNELGLENTSKA